MDTVKPYVIGVDLGGTNTVFGIVNQRGEILFDDSIKTQAYATAEQFVEAGVACLKPLIERAGGIDNIKAMGIGAPNGNYYTNAIEFAPNLPWKGVVPLGEMFSKALGIPVALYGHDGFAGELGHVTMVRGEEGRPCGCGRKGCLEAYCSATGVARTAREILAKTDRPSLLREIAPEKIESLDVSIAAGKGDEVAKEIFEFTGKMLGEACADFTAFSSPEAYIFFGGLCKAGDLIMKPIEKSYNDHVMQIFKGKAKFLVSGLMSMNAAVLGASALGWEI